MSAGSPDERRRSIRVPREDGAILADPPLREAAALARENERRLTESPEVAVCRVAGRPFRDLRRRARGELLAVARRETARLVGEEDVGPDSSRLVVMTGHQPAPFHPGVWIKNFATHAIAERLAGNGVNLVVDGDLRSASAVRVPVGDSPFPWIETVPFDGEQPVTPWEEARVVDPDAWNSFPSRLGERMATRGAQPCVESNWCGATEGAGLADLLTRVRVSTERRWGVRNFEVRQSQLCGTSAFAWFVLHLAKEAGRFRELHNAVLAEYRTANRIRSATHPVPALVAGDDWTELPFWTWRDGENQRRPVVVRRRADGLALGDRREDFVTLKSDPEVAVQSIRDLASRGVRLRTRALTTTLFARLFLCDLFVHGVGGAKYDEMTDRLIERFFGLPAPRFLLLSATRHLPLAEGDGAAADLDAARADLHRLSRSLRYNADRHLDVATVPVPVRELVARKAELVEEQRAFEAARPPGRTRAERRRDAERNRRRFEELQKVNRRLSECVADRRERLTVEAERLAQSERAEAVLRNREWAWWLYPEELLRSFLTGLDVGS